MRVLILLFTFCFLFACNDTKDSLDAVKEFKPDDKYFKAGLVSLHFRTEVSPIPEVGKAFEQTIKAYNLPVNAQGCRDGVYIGESPYDAYDYRHSVKIEIKNNKIISVDYNEIKKGGIGKQEDKEYCEEMSASGTTPAIAYPHMEKQLLDKQELSGITAVTGASYSLYRFRYAVMIALMKARITEK